MQKLKPQWMKGELCPPKNYSFQSLYDFVMDNKVITLKNAFDHKLLEEIPQQTLAWCKNNTLFPPQTYLNSDTGNNYHVIEKGISPYQKTKHNYHAFNFFSPDELNNEYKKNLQNIYKPLLKFYNRLTGNNFSFTPNKFGYRVCCQIIHYPSNGGMFGKHIHLFDPQKIGMILELSSKEKYGSGGVFFETDNEIISGHETNIGDLTLFKYDTPHGVSLNTSRNERYIDYESIIGRWTLVMPVLKF